MTVLSRHHHGAHITGLHILTIDDQRDFHHLLVLAVEFGLEGCAFGRAGSVAVNRFVFRFSENVIRVVHNNFFNILIIKNLYFHKQ